MIDPKRVAESEAKGLAFVCRLCERWYEGEDLGLEDVEGDAVCASKDGCCSPISGGSFHKYRGPLEGHLAKYCYVCGKENPEKALEAQMAGGKRVGCCDSCFENVVKRSAKRQPGRKIIFTTEKRAGPDQFDAISR